MTDDTSDVDIEIVGWHHNGRAHVLGRLGGNVIHSDTMNIESSRSRKYFLKALAGKAPALQPDQLEELEQKLVSLVAAEAERRAAPPPDEPARPNPDTEADEGLHLPEIIINRRQLRHVARDAWNAVFKMVRDALPRLYSRKRTVVAVVGMPDEPKLHVVSTDHMHARLARVATWKKYDKDEIVDCYPSPRVATDMLELPDIRLQPLDAIVSMPFFAASGELITKAGYYPKEAILLHNPLEIGDVPKEPTAEDVQAARDSIDEILHDFKFAAQSDYTHAVGMLVTPVVRRLIRRCSPLHSVEAPTPGSGKGLLVSAIVETITGKPVLTHPFPTDAEETRKAITAILSDGPAFVLLDNAKQGHTVDSPTLAAVLTANDWSDRWLGTPRRVTFPNATLWMMTANNPAFSMEMVRRTVRVRIDPRQERPWERDGFRHPHLLDWIAANRGQLVRAIAVFVRYWIAQGRPKPPKRLGSFETWSDVVGGILTAAGYPGFLEGQEQMYAAADREGAEWGDFVEAWWKHYESKPQTVAVLRLLCINDRVLTRVIGGGSDISQLTRLGTALIAQRDRCYRGYRIELAEDLGHKGKQYRITWTGDLAPRRGTHVGQGSPAPSRALAGPCDGSGNLGSVGATSAGKESDLDNIEGGQPECGVQEDFVEPDGPEAPQVPHDLGTHVDAEVCDGGPYEIEAPRAVPSAPKAPPPSPPDPKNRAQAAVNDATAALEAAVARQASPADIRVFAIMLARLTTEEHAEEALQKARGAVTGGVDGT